MKIQVVISGIIALFISNFVSAQSYLKYGVRGSVGLTNLTEVHNGSKSRTGLQVSGVIGIPIDANDQFIFQPEITLSGQGERSVYKTPDGNVDQKIFFTFINVPLNLKAYLLTPESNFFIEFGPFIGFKIGENVTEFNFAVETDSETYSSFDFGVGAGVGYSFNRKLEFTVRYSLGLTDMVENDFSGKTNQSSNLNFGLTYFFVY